MARYYYKSERSGGLLKVRPVDVPSLNSTEQTNLTAELIAAGETDKLEIYNTDTGFREIWNGTEFAEHGSGIPQLTTLQRDAIALPTVGLKIYNTDNDREEYYHPTDGWIPTGRYSGNTITNFQGTVTNTDGEVIATNYKISGNSLTPINAVTGANLPNAFKLGSASVPMGESYFARAYAGKSDGNGLIFNGISGTTVWAINGTGGGVNLEAGTRVKLRACYNSNHGSLMTDGTLASTKETDTHVSAQFTGHGITVHEGQTGTVIEGLASFASLSDGAKVYIDDATSAVTFTSVGMWIKDAGVWIKQTLSTASSTSSEVTQIAFADSPYTPIWGQDIEVDTTLGDVVINLPTAVGNNGSSITVTKTVLTNTITNNPNGAQTINGRLFDDIDFDWTSAVYKSNGTNITKR